jgi:hypothetical protein
MENNISKTMSTYEKTLNRMRKVANSYQDKCVSQKRDLLKANTFINALRDKGLVSKDEIELYFKK